MNNHIGKASTPINLRALELIREAMKGSPLTQEDLSRRTSIPRSTLANILSPTAEPRLLSIDWFTRIAYALDAPVDDWLDELETLARKGFEGGATVTRLPKKRTGPSPIKKKVARVRKNPGE